MPQSTIHENRDNVSTVNDIEHGRSYSFVTTLMPNSKVFFDLGYTYTDIYNQAQICYYANAFGPPPATQCPASLGVHAARDSWLRGPTPASSTSRTATSRGSPYPESPPPSDTRGRSLAATRSQ